MCVCVRVCAFFSDGLFRWTLGFGRKGEFQALPLRGAQAQIPSSRACAFV